MLENFEEWAVIVGAGSALLLDLFPVLRFVRHFLPSYRDAKKLNTKESALYMEHWASTKARIYDGTALVSVI